MYIRRLKFNSEFLQSLFVLLSGTIVAQLIGYALAPVITRMYTPSEMGDFGVFHRWVVLIATIATARFEFALPIPKKDHHAFLLYQVALRTTTIVAVITFLCYLFYGIWSSNNEFVFYILPLLILCVCSLAFMNLGTNWAIRKKQFKKISYSKMTNSLSLNISRVVFGFLNFGKWGLFLSFLISLVMGSYHFLKDFFSARKSALRDKKTKRMRIIAGKYKDFPFSSLPHALSDNLRDLILAMLLVYVFSEEIFGAFDHSLRMLRIPLMIVGTSLGQVFFSKISEAKKNNLELMPLVLKVTKYLFLLSVIPFLLVIFFGEELFSFVFGNQWAFSGRLSEIMTPWLWINFIISPLSVIPLVLGKQRSFFIIGLISSLLQVASFYLFSQIFKGSTDQIEITFTISNWIQFAMAIYTLIYFYFLIKKNDSQRITE